MFIAVTSEGKDLESQVSEKFESCKYLLIVEMENLNVEVIINNFGQSSVALAEAIVAHDCEAVITGEIEQPAFDIIADACITRYKGNGNKSGDALQCMERYELELIRNVEGTDHCDDDHHKHH